MVLPSNTPAVVVTSKQVLFVSTLLFAALLFSTHHHNHPPRDGDMAEHFHHHEEKQIHRPRGEHGKQDHPHPAGEQLPMERGDQDVDQSRPHHDGKQDGPKGRFHPQDAKPTEMMRNRQHGEEVRQPRHADDADEQRRPRRAGPEGHFFAAHVVTALVMTVSGIVAGFCGTFRSATVVCYATAVSCAVHNICGLVVLGHLCHQPHDEGQHDVCAPRHIAHVAVMINVVHIVMLVLAVRMRRACYTAVDNSVVLAVVIDDDASVTCTKEEEVV